MRRLVLSALVAAVVWSCGALAQVGSPISAPPACDGGYNTPKCVTVQAGTTTTTSPQLMVGSLFDGAYQDSLFNLHLCAGTVSSLCPWVIEPTTGSLQNFTSAKLSFTGYNQPLLETGSTATPFPGAAFTGWRSGNTNSGGSIILGRSASGTVGTAGAVQATYNVGSIFMLTDDGQSTGGNALDVTSGGLVGTVEGTVSAGAVPMQLGFWATTLAGTLQPDLAISTEGSLYMGPTGTSMINVSNATTGKLIADRTGNLYSLSVTTPAMAAGTLALCGVCTIPTLGGNEGFLGLTAGGGLTVMGQGTTNDVTIRDKIGSAVLTVPTGTVNIVVAGDTNTATETVTGILTTQSGTIHKTRTATTTPVTVATTDEYVGTNLSVAGAVAVSLPGAAANGTRFCIKDRKGDANVNNITITPTSGTIDGSANDVLNTARGGVCVMSDGTNYFIESSNSGLL